MGNTCSSDCISTNTERTPSNCLRQGSEVLASLQFTAARTIKKVVHAGLVIMIIGITQVMAQDMNTYPDIVGEHLSVVKDSLDKHGIELLIEKIDSPVQTGKIMRQVPPVETPFGKTRKMYLLVSDGLEIPDVIGDDVEDARERLEKMGFSVDTSRFPVIDIPDDDIEYPDPLNNVKIVYTIPAARKRINPAYETVFLVASRIGKVRVPQNLLSWSWPDYDHPFLKRPNLNFMISEQGSNCMVAGDYGSFFNILIEHDMPLDYCDCFTIITKSDPAPGELIPIGTVIKINTFYGNPSFCHRSPYKMYPP